MDADHDSPRGTSLDSRRIHRSYAHGYADDDRVLESPGTAAKQDKVLKDTQELCARRIRPSLSPATAAKRDKILKGGRHMDSVFGKDIHRLHTRVEI